MKLKGLLSAAVLLAALGGAVYWSNKDEESKKGKPDKDAAPKILEVPEDQFTQLEFQRKGGEATTVRKNKDGKWEITAPRPMTADAAVVGTVVSALAVFNSDKLVEEKAGDLKGYGLDAPSVQINITKKDGKVIKVLLGDDTAIGSATYVKVDGDARVFTVLGKNTIDKDWKALRDRRLLTFDGDKLTRVELMAGKDTVEFARNGSNNWTILKPKPLRGDNFAVEELVRKLKDAKMDEVPDADAAAEVAKKFAAGTLVGKARATDAGTPQEIEVRKDKDGAYYAKSNVVEGVYKVANELGEGIAKKLDDFRNKKLFDFSFSDPSRIEVKAPERAWVYEKSKTEWKRDGKIVRADMVQSLSDKLKDLSSVAFLDKANGAPYAEFTVTTQDGKVVEKVIVSKAGESYVAVRGGEAAVYGLDPKTVDELIGAAKIVQEGTGEKAPPKDPQKK